MTKFHNASHNDEIMATLAPGTQCHAVLDHLRRKGTITQVEAHELYRVYRLASRINDLKNEGVSIRALQRRDLTGHRYTAYALSL